MLYHAEAAKIGREIAVNDVKINRHSAIKPNADDVQLALKQTKFRLAGQGAKMTVLGRVRGLIGRPSPEPICGVTKLVIRQR